MINIKHTPYFIGFDEFFEDAETISDRSSGGLNYPPHNIYVNSSDSNSTFIEIAVAGFCKDEISVKHDPQESSLIIEGKKEASLDNRRFQHKGISNKAFTKSFKLGEYVKVKSVDLSDGILEIELYKEIPESQKPKELKIGWKDKQLLTED